MLNKTAILSLAILMALPVVAGRVEIDETHKASPDGEVSVELLAGTVTVTGWDRDQVHITGSYDSDFEELEVDTDEGEISIEVDIDDDDNHRTIDRGADLTIRVPKGAMLSVETVSASISVDGVTGELDLESVSGNVDIATMPAALDVETVSGNIYVASAPADSDVSSVNGKIEIQAAGGSIDVENVSGETMIHGGVIDNGDLESVSGNITCHAIPGPDGRLDIETMSGVITLVIDSSLTASFDLSTFSGSIENQIGPEPRRTSKYTPGKELYFNTGTSGPNISLESFSGSIKLITR